jgi:hypothetical protein
MITVFPWCGEREDAGEGDHKKGEREKRCDATHLFQLLVIVFGREMDRPILH